MIAVTRKTCTFPTSLLLTWTAFSLFSQPSHAEAGAGSPLFDDGISLNTYPSDREPLSEAWFTGSLLSSSSATLPKGGVLFESYLFDIIETGMFDDASKQVGAPHTHSLQSLTLLLYGVTDDFMIGILPRFGSNAAKSLGDATDIGVGDLTFRGQYQISQYGEGGWIPTTSLFADVTVPSGKYDNLTSNATDAVGAGVYAVKPGILSQYYFWLPDGRIVRMRLDLSYAISTTASIDNRSTYGTPDGFIGIAKPGNTFSLNSSYEYSITSNIAVSLDINYTKFDKGGINGFYHEGEYKNTINGGFGLWTAPAIEYNFNKNVGLIFGTRLSIYGKNISNSFAPIAALNCIF